MAEGARWKSPTVQLKARAHLLSYTCCFPNNYYNNAKEMKIRQGPCFLSSLI